MATYWRKDDWLPNELDPISGQTIPGAMPPGIYCEDDEAFRVLKKACGVERVAYGFTQRVGDDPTWRPLLTVAGMMIRVATQAEAEILRTLAPAASDPADAVRLAELKAAKVEADREARPFRGVNRRARRAAAANARRTA